MKKILFSIFRLTGGGAERVVSVWASELARLGYDVHVLAMYPQENEYEMHADVKKHYVSSDKSSYLSLGFLQKVKGVRRCLKGISPEYMISFLPSTQRMCMFAAWGLDIRRIETIRINPWWLREYYHGSLEGFLWRRCYKTCDKIILQASDQKTFFSKKEQKKCILIPNPISPYYLDHFKEALESTPTSFVAAGRITDQKNYPMMIEGFAKACEKNEDIRLKIFGTGDEKAVAALQKMIDEKGLHERILLMGRTPHMEKEYGENDIFLMTSDFEGLPNALMEAMASRLVCIATDCKTGVRDLIQDGENGFLVPVGDADALADVILKVLSLSKEARDDMADAARQKILTDCATQHSVSLLCGLFD